VKSAMALRFTLLIWLGSLFALFGIERWIVDPIGSLAANAIVFAVQTAPIVAVAVLSIRDAARGALWAALASLVYFVHGIARVVSPMQRFNGAIEIIFALGTFASGLVLLRVLPPRAAATPDDHQSSLTNESRKSSSGVSGDGASTDTTR
jgi:uncharacterized membrane protein